MSPYSSRTTLRIATLNIWNNSGPWSARRELIRRELADSSVCNMVDRAAVGDRSEYFADTWASGGYGGPGLHLPPEKPLRRALARAWADTTTSRCGTSASASGRSRSRG